MNLLLQILCRKALKLSVYLIYFIFAQNQQNNHIIEWLSSGKQFIIKDTDLFENVILPHYFRHRNINSFIRQLNMYGFHKSRKQPTKNIFSHPNFVKGKPDFLINVKRKLKQDKIQENILTTVNHLNNMNNPNRNIPNIIKKIKIENYIKQQKTENNKILNQNSMLLSRETLKSRNNFDNSQHHMYLRQKKQKQLQKTAIKPSQPLTSFCSLGYIQDHSIRVNTDIPPFIRCLFQKSQIMSLNPQVYDMKYQNITSLNNIDQIDFQFQCNDDDIHTDEIQKQRKKLNNRMIGYNILQTINFMSEFEIQTQQ